MTKETQSVVIIGAGQAGLSLCAKLRSLGHTGPITLLGAEEVPPYQRPPLSKAYALGEMDVDRLLLRPAEFFEKNSISLITGCRAAAIDRSAKTVVAESGDAYGYDSLVLATGASPRKLPKAIGGEFDGVQCIRTLKDADVFSNHLKNAKSALVVGGGYIGLEAASVASKSGLAVTLIEASDRILGRVACPETSNYFRTLHEQHGVEILEGTGLEELIGPDSRVTGALLSDGRRISADFVVVGIGVSPASELAEACGLDLDNGIATDAQCRTSDPDIYAVGDCASFPYRGTRIRLESVGNAIAQAEAAAASILGHPVTYAAKPWFWSDQYNVKLQIAGLNTGYETIVTRRIDDTICSFWYFRGEELLAVDALNDPRAYMVGKRMIEAGQSPLPAEISNPDQDLKSLTLQKTDQAASPETF